MNTILGLLGFAATADVDGSKDAPMRIRVINDECASGFIRCDVSSYANRVFLFFNTTPLLSGAVMRTLQNIFLPYIVSLKLIPRFQCVHGILGVDQSNTAGSIGWQCEAFDQDIVKIEFH